MSDDFDLDDMDFDDLDFGDDLGTPGAPPEDRKPIEVVTSSFAEGAVDTLQNPETIKNVITKALPGGYGDAADGVEDIVTSASDLYDTTARELKPAIRDFKRAVRTMLPKEGGVLPEKLLGKIQEWTKTDEEAKREAAVNEEESQVQLGISDLLEAQQHYESQKQEQDVQKRVYEYKNDKEKTAAMLERLDAMRSSLGRMVGYQDGVASKLHRKSLELQYRQYFLARKHFTLQEGHVAQSKQLLDAIVKNTGLPDYLKTRVMETSGAMLREKMLGKVHNTAADFGRNYSQQLFKNVQAKATGFAQQVKDKVSSISDMSEAMSMMDEMGDMGMDDGASKEDKNLEMAGNMAGSAGTGFLLNKLAERIAPFIANNPQVSKIGNQLSYYANNREAILERVGNGELIGTQKDEDGFEKDSLWNKIAGMVNSSVAEIIPKYNHASTLASGGATTDEAPFTNQTQRSIVEVIPGFLSKILQEVASIRKGEVVDREVYDHERFGFTSEARYTDKLLSKISPDGVDRSLEDQTDRILKTFDDDASMSEEARDALMRKMVSDQMNGVIFKPELYADPEKLTGMAEDLRQEISGFFSKHTKEADSDKYFGKLQDATNDYSRFGSITGDPRAAMESMIQGGDADILRKLGVISDGAKEVDRTDSVASLIKGGRDKTALTELGLIDAKGKQATDVNAVIREAESKGLGRTLRSLGLGSVGGTSINANYDGLMNQYMHTTKDVESDVGEQVAFNVGGGYSKAQAKETPAIEAKVSGLDELADTIKSSIEGLSKFFDLGPITDRLERMLTLTEAAQETSENIELVTGVDKSNTLLQKIIDILLDPPWGGKPSGGGSGGPLDEAIAAFMGNASKFKDKVSDVDYMRLIREAQRDSSDAVRGKLEQGAEKLDPVMAELMSRYMMARDDAGDIYGTLKDTPNDELMQRMMDMMQSGGNAAQNKATGFLGRMKDKVTDSKVGKSLMGRKDDVSSKLSAAKDKSVQILDDTMRRGFEALDWQTQTAMMESNPKLKAFILGEIPSYYGASESGGMLGKLKSKFGKKPDFSALKNYDFSKVGKKLPMGGFQKLGLGGKLKRKVSFNWTDIRNKSGELLLSAKNLKAGKYFDAQTGKVISKLKDIKGEIVDEQGNVVVSMSDIKDGLMDKKGLIGRSIGFLGSMGGKVLDVYRMGFVGAGKAAISAGGSLLGMARKKVTDIYVRGSEHPAIQAQLLKAGHYYDKQSGKVIKSFEDIKGEVIDKEGNLVLSVSDLTAGLVDLRGKPLVVKAAGLLKRGVGLAFTPYRMVGRGIKKLFEKRPKDIYGKDDPETPKLFASMLANGSYRSKHTGKVITTIKDIDGPVIDRDNNIVLSSEDIQKGLVDDQGKPHRAGSLLSGAVGLASGAAGMVGSYIKGSYSLMGKMAKGVGGGVSALLGGGLGGLGSYMKGEEGPQGVSSDQAKRTNDLLTEIRDDIRDWMPVKHRKGSWKAKMAADKKRKAEEELKEGQTKDTKGNGLLKKLMAGGGLGGLLGMGGGDGDGPGFLEGGAAAYLAGKAKGVLSKGKDLASKGVDKVKGLFSKGKNFLSKNWKRVAKSPVGKKVGKFLTKQALKTAGKWALRAVAGTAAVAAGIISAPVALVVGGVILAADLAYDGYKLYKGIKLSGDNLTGLRLLEYGAEDLDFYEAALNLEQFLDPFVKRSDQGSTIDTGQNEISLKAMMDFFDSDHEDQEERDSWMNWFQNRFKPVYLQYHTALATISKHTKFTDMESLSPEQKIRMVKGVKWPVDHPSNPYIVTSGPMEGDEIEVESSAIYDKFTAVMAAYKEEMAKGDTKGTQSPDQKTMPSNVAALTVKKPGSYSYTTQRPRGARAKPSTPEKAVGAGTVLATGARGMRYETTVDVSMYSRKSTGDLLDEIRLYCYGLDPKQPTHCDAIDKLEDALREQVRMSAGRRVSFGGNPEQIANEHMGNFNLDADDSNSKDKWLAWFQNRFIPVYTRYAQAVFTLTRKSFRSIDPNTIANDVKLSIARVMINTQTESDGQDVSVFRITDSPFDSWEVITDKATPMLMIKALESRIAKLEAARAEARRQTPQVEKVKEQSAQADQRELDRLAAEQKRQSAAKQTELAAEARKGGSAPAKPTGGKFTPITATEPLPTVRHPGQGKDGDINEIPESKGDGSWAAHKDTILAASEMAGVDPLLMATMASIESGFRGMVKASTSSATGLYQFINSTWKNMISKYGSKYGIAENTPRTDTRANALMGAEFLKENQRAAQGKLGREVNAADLYTMHFMGAKGGLDLLTSNAEESAAGKFPAAAKANRSIFYTRSGGGRTVNGVYDELARRVRNHSAMFVGGDELIAANDPVAPEAPTPPMVDSKPETATMAPPASVKMPDVASEAPKVKAVPFKAPATALAPVPAEKPAPVKDGLAQKRMDAESTAHQIVAKRSAEQVQTQTKDIQQGQSRLLVQAATLLENQLQVQKSMDSSLKSIDDGITKLNKSVLKQTKSKVEEEVPEKEDPKLVRGNRAQRGKAALAPITMKRKA